MVSAAQQTKASKYLQNVPAAAAAADATRVPFFLICAVLDLESEGRNVYGNDAGGALGGFPGPVDASTYAVFRWLVFDRGQTSNGVGPMQLTWPGFFEDMEKRKLRPWQPADNVLYGAGLLKQYVADAKAKNGTKLSTIAKYVGRQYNGSASYGDLLAAACVTWAKRLGIANPKL